MSYLDDAAAHCHMAEMDVFDFMATVEDESVDGILTDVPYPTTERYRAIGTTTRTKESDRSSNPWFKVLTFAQLDRFLNECYRVLKPDSYALVYVDTHTEWVLAYMRGVIVDLMKLNDVEKLRTQAMAPTSRAPRDTIGFGWWGPWTWGKVAKEDDGAEALEDTRLAVGTGYHGRKTTERLLVLEKGKKNMLTSMSDLQLWARPSAPKGAERKKAAAKAIGLARRVAECIVEPDGVILDPFVGSGTHAVGVLSAGRDFIGNDLDLSLFRDWAPKLGLSGWSDW